MTRPLRYLTALTAAVVLVACGRSAPQTPEAMAEALVAGFASKDSASLQALLPNADDFREVAEKRGEPLTDEKLGKAMAGIAAEAVERWDRAMTAATTAGIDFATLTLGTLETEERDADGTTEVRVKAPLGGADIDAALTFRAHRVSRGLVLTRPPRLEIATACDKAVDHLITLMSGSDDDMLKAMASSMQGQRDRAVEDCDKEAGERPIVPNCVLAAKDAQAAMACLKKPDAGAE